MTMSYEIDCHAVAADSRESELMKAQPVTIRLHPAQIELIRSGAAQLRLVIMPADGADNGKMDLLALPPGEDTMVAHGQPLPQPDYLIWSTQHRAWWRPEAAGYSVSIEGAGLYTRAEAIEIAATLRDGWSMGRVVPDEIAVALADIPEHIRAAVLALHGRAS